MKCAQLLADMAVVVGLALAYKVTLMVHARRMVMVQTPATVHVQVIGLPLLIHLILMIASHHFSINFYLASQAR